VVDEPLIKVFRLLYLMLPAYAANMAPPFVKYWRGWNRPLNRRLLGEHKTIVGFMLGVLAALLVAYAQSCIDWNGNLVDYSNWLVLGPALGFGAMGGDSLKSLFKRARGIPPGQSWMLADQLDFVLGALIMVWPWARLGWMDAAVILTLSFIGDIAVNHIACWLGIRDTRW
jgi:CDP-2,3-bis-(O-geranylgeranyl)-sn-glycerol synthase